MSKVFEAIPQNKSKESVSNLLTKGGVIADDILIKLEDAKDTVAVNGLALQLSDDLAGYAKNSSRRDNQLVLMGVLQKILKANFPDESEQVS